MRVMILGAGIYQVPLIKKAKEMGLETLVLSSKGNYPGISMADIFLEIDTTDANRILQTAREYDISGIVTTGTDVSVPSIGAVVDALNLKGPSRKAAETVSSKTSFRSFLKKNSFNCPSFRVCENSQDVIDFYQESDVKIVLKPDDSSGSRGVTVLDRDLSQHSIVRAYQTAKSFSRNGRVCAESFLPGIEVGGDAFLINGEVLLFVTTRKHLQGVMVLGHSLPGNLSPTELLGVKTEIQKVTNILGYTEGPVNFDVMLDSDNATILEMGLRNGGNGIVDLIYHSCNIDLTTWSLSVALGRSVPHCDQSSVKEISSYIFGAKQSGRLQSISSLTELQAEVPEVIDVILAKQIGDTVEVFNHNANLVGYVLMRCGSKDYENVVSRIRQVMKVKVSA